MGSEDDTGESALPGWLIRLVEKHGCDGPSCAGSIRSIDAAARLRGAAAVRTGNCLSLGRPVVPEPSMRPGEDRESTAVSCYVHESGPYTVGTDRIELEPHGVANTHIDGLAHVGVGRTWHGGASAAATSGDDRVAAWAAHGLVTRAIVLDVPSARGEPWVRPDSPVTDADLDRCEEQAGIEVEPGDAVLLYMGRDRFEAAGHPMTSIGSSESGRPGVGPLGAEWLAQHQIGLLCWDFLDAMGPGIPPMSVHLLTWGIGLAIVDNCHLGPAAAAVRSRVERSGLLAVAPLRLPAATGCMVNPLFTC